MTLRFVAAVVILLFAALLQFWLAGTGVAMNLIFATLIAFAFLFGLPEILFFILFSLFVLNWRPGFTPEFLLFALVPIGAYVLHRFAAWQAWAGALFTITGGVVLLYVALAPGMFLAHFGGFALDLLGCLFFGGAAFFLLDRRAGR